MRAVITAGVAGLVACALAASPAAAQDAPVTVESGNKVLAVVADAEGVFARVCAKGAACDARSGQMLRPPPSFRGGADKTAIQPIDLGGNKRLVWASFRGDEGRGFQLLLAAPQKGEEARVVYSGVTGRAEGSDRTTSFVVDQQPAGPASVVLTTTAKLCEKDVLVSTRRLDPNRLELVATAGPDPLGGRRAGAIKVAATLAAKAASGFRVLRARSASSGRPQGAVDGDADTAWVEDELGTGRHAFASFGAPAGVAITGFELGAKRPADLAEGRAPKSVSIVVDGAVYSVSLPDPKAEAAPTYAIALPAPIKTACVGLVVEEVYPAPGGTKTKADPAAFVSELSARTELEGSSLDSLALGLAGGGQPARDRLALLEAEGKRGLAAVIGAYDELDGPGRDLARRIIDAAPCKDKLGLYIPLLTGKDREEADRARDRVRRCGKEAGPPLLSALEHTKGDARIVVAEEAAFVAPDAAVPFLVRALDQAKTPEERRPFRRAIGKAATRDVGVRALGRATTDPAFAKLSLPARVDFLRGLGDEASRVEGAAAALAATSKEATAFRERYLLLSPAASLAKSGDKRALDILGAALGDARERRLRARGAELAAGIALLRPRLLTLIDDPEVRVREAALGALAQKGALDKAATVKLLVRLVKDPWTFVRRAAAAALVSAPTNAETDKAIGAAVDFEPSPIVRAEMMTTLGARKAKAATPVVAERAFDQRETADVRARALEALGDLCASDHLEGITELALRGQAPVFEADRKLAVAGITALGRLRPADLKARLAPLSAKNAPAEIREVTRLVLADPARPCSAPRPGAGAK